MSNDSTKKRGLPGLRALRKSKGLRQQDLASAIGRVTSVIYKAEAGQSNCSPDLLDRLCEFFSCTPNDLLLAPPGDEAVAS